LRKSKLKKQNNFIFEDKNIENDNQKLIDKIMKNNFITKNSVDIISLLLNYIKEEIFRKYIKYIFLVLEDNNILTTLIEIQNSQNKEINEKIIIKLIEDSLDQITYDVKRDYKPKFLYNYKIPGFYNSFKNLSVYINKNIIIDYFNYEKNLRKYGTKVNIKKKKNEFYENEKKLLSIYIYDFLITDEQFLFENIENIDINIILKDYISFYLDKYNIKSEANNNLIELLLNLRHKSEKNNKIKDEEKGPIKMMLMKIMWMETNTNYILTVIQIYSQIEKLYNDKEKLFDMVKNNIYGPKRCLK